MDRYKTFEFEEIGTVLLRKNPRAKNLTIRIKPQTGVQVTVPNGMSFRSAAHFVEKKREWILRHLEELRVQEKQREGFYDGTQTLKTRYHHFDVQASDENLFSVLFEQGRATAFYPEELNLSDRVVQSFIKTAYIETLRREAKKYLPDRLAALATKYGFKYNKVFIKNHRSRWGSCSEKNNINLNLHLMRLPDALIDYVLLHELVHTEIKNHSPAFWARVDGVCEGSVSSLRKAIRKYKI